ncbi:hypothetical protein ENSA5_58220 [Enhygromyxa salina]|uniref:Gamma-glutamylcyclotransferase AIG2-like domain-containing protein n=2 Tax=Enhygromyxa salina TaxID=215803 RepID=A0A2S9XDZ6_9BACT|nr:hypothetical protein ENSA5_58220 [Enhygromyxa salina]
MVGCHAPSVGSEPSQEPSQEVEVDDVNESELDTPEGQTRVFLFGAQLDLPEGCDAQPAQPMRVRGYQLGFVAEHDGAHLVTLQPIRGDGTVPGLSYVVSAPCLQRLQAAFASAGLEPTELQVEPPSAGRSAPTTPATAWLAPSDRPPAAASPDEVSALREAWTAAGLDTRAIDDAVGVGAP